MSELITERITDNLDRLRLSRTREILSEVHEEAQSKDLTYLAFLDRLLEEEVVAKEERRVKTALKTGGLPFEKTIEEYDFSFHPDLDKRFVMGLFDLDFLSNQENVIFLGPPGVGKTHLAVALAIKACYFGVSIYFMTMADLIGKLNKDAEYQGRRRGRSYYKSALVVVDEVGYMPVTQKEAHLFFQFVSYRYEKASTIITSNKSFSEWADFFGDPVVTTAILDRLLHHCHIINIKGKSFRLKGYNDKTKL